MCKEREVELIERNFDQSVIDLEASILGGSNCWSKANFEVAAPRQGVQQDPRFGSPFDLVF
jgi:hypothetical protein